MRMAGAFAYLLSAAVLGTGGSGAQAQDWPTHPVKIIVPYGPGGIADVFGRITADRLTSILKETPRLCRGGSRSLTFRAVVHR
jgi:tripartite-type tricarboxylate transporter receptor subunit TctC